MDKCSDGKDNDCDGTIDEMCGCNDGDKQTCYEDPPGTEDKGNCKVGHKYCRDGKWGLTCNFQVVPTKEVCNNQDDDCDGIIDNLANPASECGAGYVCYQGNCVVQ